MFFLIIFYYSIGISLLNLIKDEWLKFKLFCFRLFFLYESIIGVRCDENFEVVKKIVIVYSSKMYLFYGCYINDRI